MTAVFTAEEILEICSGRLAAGMLEEEAGAICNDTRELEQGNWYLALAGKQFDGHDFLGDAFSAGALGAIVAERPFYPLANPQFSLLSVPDTTLAYLALARNWRKRINPKVAVWSSSTPQLIFPKMAKAVFSATRVCHCYQSFGAEEPAEIGIAKSLLSMPPDSKVAIVEVATEGIEQVDLLAKILSPNLVIITDTACDSAAKAQNELLHGLDSQRTSVIIGSGSSQFLNQLLAGYQGKSFCYKQEEIHLIETAYKQTKFRLENSEQLFTVNGSEEAILESAWLLITMGRELGLADAEIAEGLNSFQQD